MAGMLYRTDATDPWTFSAVAALLFSSALAASAIPAQHASKVDPMVALRNE
jgi:ABC-type lipoprotein release transport system permease subunit